MPNTLTSIFVSNPATEPVEAPHPNTGVYVTGTQATAGGPWTVIHTLVSKTTTPLTMVGRLVNFKTITVAVVATGGPNAGNIFNNVLTTPTGMAGTGTTTTTINVTVSSIANQTGYRLFAADTSAGTYSQIYQGATASYSHTGLSAGQVKYYKWQYVGGGYYDDSLLSDFFSGSAAAGAFPAKLHFAGDSITAGTLYTSWVETLKTLVSTSNFPVAGYNNKAVSGQCSDQQLATEPTDIIAAKGTGGGTYLQDIAVLFIGVNDLRIGDSTSLHAGLYRTKDQIAHDILEWGRQARLNGFKPVLITFGADRRLNVTNPTEDTRMANLMIDVNNITTLNATKYGFVTVMDDTSDSFIGTVSSPIAYAGSYYSNDFIHPSNQGEAYIANKIRPIIEQVSITALTAFTDPGQYVAGASVTPAAASYTPYPLVGISFAEVVNATVSATTITGQGVFGGTPTQFWGSATSTNKASSTTNTVIAYVEQIANDNNKESLFGWNNNNTATDYSDLKFAWHLKTAAWTAANPLGGTAYGIRPFGYGDPSLPNGSNATGFIPYVAGDVLRVTIEQGRVVWYQNGIQRFVVALTLAPIDYFIDMALVPGGVVSDIRVGAANWIARPGIVAAPATPANIRAAAAFKVGVNVTVTGNNIKKTAGVDGTFNAGTTGTIALGTSAATVRGSLDFVANKNGGSDLIGFHAGIDQDATHTQLISAGAVSIQVSNNATDNGFRWFINGVVSASFIAYAEGDRIKLEVQQSTIVIYQNGTQVGSIAYTLPVNSYIDSSILALNTSISDVYIQADNPITV